MFWLAIPVHGAQPSVNFDQGLDISRSPDTFSGKSRVFDELLQDFAGAPGVQTGVTAREDVKLPTALQPAAAVARTGERLPANINLKASDRKKIEQLIRITNYAVSKVYKDRSPADRNNAFLQLLATAHHESWLLTKRIQVDAEGRPVGPAYGITQVQIEDAKYIMDYLTGRRMAFDGGRLAETIAAMLGSVLGREITIGALTLRTGKQLANDLVASDAFAVAIAGARSREDSTPLCDFKKARTTDGLATMISDYWANVHWKGSDPDSKKLMKEHTKTILEKLQAQGFKFGKEQNWRVTPQGLDISR